MFAACIQRRPNRRIAAFGAATVENNILRANAHSQPNFLARVRYNRIGAPSIMMLRRWIARGRQSCRHRVNDGLRHKGCCIMIEIETGHSASFINRNLASSFPSKSFQTTSVFDTFLISAMFGEIDSKKLSLAEM